MMKFYIGFTDQKEEGKFEWIVNHNSSYTNWCDGEPNNHENVNENTVEIKISSGCWNDILSEHLRHFICEI